MGWFGNDHDHTQANNKVSLVLRNVCCVVFKLIATGFSTKRPLSTRLTSVMSSFLVLLPIRFDPVVLSFPVIFKYAIGCQGI